MLIFLVLIPLQLFAEHLYVIHARSGEIDQKQLILSDIDHSVIYFTQEDDRQAGVMPLNQFLLHWETGEDFGTEGAPSRYVSYIKAKTAFSEGPYDLIYPRYNQAEETLIFTIKGKGHKKATFGETALFLTHE